MMVARSPQYEQLLTKLKPFLEALDEMRQCALLNIVITVGIFSIAWIALWYTIFVAHGSGNINGHAWNFLFVPIAGVATWSYWFFTRNLRAQFKKGVIRKFVALVNPTFGYEPGSCVDMSEYDLSGIFHTAYDKYVGDDYVRGRVGDVHLEFSEIHTSFETGGRDRRRVTIFHGLFAVADFKKNFKGSTYVLPDEAESLLGWVGQQLQSMNISHGELVKMEDPEFEKLFVVYADDQIESRYILSTSLMQRITEFRKKAKVKVSFAFRYSKLYVAIHRNHNLFEPGLLTSYLKEGALDCYMDDLELIMGMVDELNLNLDIWSYAQRKAV